MQNGLALMSVESNTIVFGSFAWELADEGCESHRFTTIGLDICLSQQLSFPIRAAKGPIFLTSNTVNVRKNDYIII